MGGEIMFIKTLGVLFLSMSIISCLNPSSSTTDEIIFSQKRANPKQGIGVDLDDLCRDLPREFKLEHVTNKVTPDIEYVYFKFVNESNLKVFVNLSSDHEGYWTNSPFIDFLYKESGSQDWRKSLYGPIDVETLNLRKVKISGKGELTFRVPVIRGVSSNTIESYRVMLSIYKTANKKGASGCVLSTPFIFQSNKKTRTVTI